MMSLPLSTKNPRSQKRFRASAGVFFESLKNNMIETEKAKLVVEEQKKTWWGDIAYKSYLSKQ
jgi:hypothetical protein